MLRVEEALADERDRAEERHGISAAAAAALTKRERDVQRDRGPHDLQAAPRIGHGPDLRLVERRRDVDERALALEEPSRRRGEHGSDAGRRQARQLGRVGPDDLGGLELRSEDDAALPALGILQRAERRRRRGRRSIEARAVAHVDEARIDAHAGAVDDRRVVRYGHVGTDRIDQSVAQHDRARRNRRAARRDQTGAANRVDVGPIRARRDSEGKGAGGDAERESRNAFH